MQIVWDYAPSDMNLCQGRNFSNAESIYTVQSTYYKAQFQQFSNARFTTKVVRPHCIQGQARSSGSRHGTVLCAVAHPA